jgi:simple sugar transport system permease protein
MGFGRTGKMRILSIIFSVQFFHSILRITTPILFAAMGTMLTTSAGVVNVVQEGIMLIAAFCGMAVSAFTQSVFLGVLAGLLSGVLIMALMALLILRYNSNPVLVGLAVNMFAAGGTVFFLYVLTGGAKGNSTQLPSLTVPALEIPLIRDIPIVGEIISGQNILTYLAVLSIVFVQLLLMRTPFGLRLRAVGENPDAAHSTGIKVNRTKTSAMLICGALCGLGGVFMSMCYVSWFSRNMVAGRGWISIAANVLGNSTIGTALASFLFGTSEATANAIGMLGLPGDIVKTLPYWVTILALLLSAATGIYRKKSIKIRRN